jgi:hypothetical protein
MMPTMEAVCGVCRTMARYTMGEALPAGWHPYVEFRNKAAALCPPCAAQEPPKDCDECGSMSTSGHRRACK